MARKRKSSVFSLTQYHGSMANITKNNISHDKAIELLTKGHISGQQTELTTQMSDKLIKFLAPTGGRTRTAPATIATVARKVVTETFSKSRYDLVTVKIPAIETWVKELKKVYPDVPHFQNNDDLDLIGDVSSKQYKFV